MPQICWHFLEISSLAFCDFLHKDAYKQCPKTRPSRIFPAEKKNENMPEPPFLQIFIRHFPYISLFFTHKKVHTIKHGSMVNKTDFCSKNFLKIAGTPDFRRKNSISWISRAILWILSWNFAHWCKMAIPKTWRSPIFEKHFFPPENAGNIPENRFFGIFSRFHH